MRGRILWLEDHLAKVRVITDSNARFENPHVVKQLNITVVPNLIRFGKETWEEDSDIDSQAILERLRAGMEPPEVVSPSVEAFGEVYEDLSRTTDQMLVVVHSQNFSDTFAHAQTARSGLLGRCEITVIDSRTTSACLGYLVEATAAAAQANQPLESVVHLARGIVPRLYSVFYVNKLDSIQKAGLIEQTQSILGAMLEIKPLLTIEDGTLITMEKARTHVRAIDKMMEFVCEFTHIERLCILQGTRRITETTRMLQDRLALEFARMQAPVMLLDPLLAARLGPECMGMAILEGTGRDDLDHLHSNPGM
jgi:DegV family protein with EDD domain